MWTQTRQRLEAAGVERPVFDARLLVEAGAGVSRQDIITDPRRTVSVAQIEAVSALAERRAAREPVAHILGRKAFWTLDLHVTRDVLIPRPETEFVVEAALAALPVEQPARVLDLGTGSGAILLAILSERPSAAGVGVDRSEAALAVARANAERLGLEKRTEFLLGDWWAEVEGSFDVIVSNPPYIVSADIAGLEPEVRAYEPLMALDGGEDGLSAYRAILPNVSRYLRPNGVFALEVGAGQAEAVMELAASAGLSTGAPIQDLAGIARVIVGKT